MGFSDHSQSILAPSLAVALGAKIIEKHFTLNNNYKGPDHSSSLNFKDFKNFINQIRQTEKILGSSIKTLNFEEKNNSKIVKNQFMQKKILKLERNSL